MREPATIGERIRVVRRREELTIDQFAAALGYSRRALVNWEQNAAQPPIGVLEPLRRLYDADPEWIATGRSRDAISPAADWDRYDRLAAMLDTVLLDTELDVGPDQRQIIVRAMYDSGIDPGDAAYAQLSAMVAILAGDPAERRPKQTMETQTSIGDRLKAVRLGAGLGQDVFAASLGYSKRSLIAWETDAASVPLKVVAMLRSIYDIDPEWIIRGAETVPASHFGPPDWNRYDRLVDMVSAVLTDMNVELAPEARQRIVRILYDTGAAAHDAVRASCAE